MPGCIACIYVPQESKEGNTSQTCKCSKRNDEHGGNTESSSQSLLWASVRVYPIPVFGCSWSLWIAVEAGNSIMVIGRTPCSREHSGSGTLHVDGCMLESLILHEQIRSIYIPSSQAETSPRSSAANMFLLFECCLQPDLNSEAGSIYTHRQRCIAGSRQEFGSSDISPLPQFFTETTPYHL